MKKRARGSASPTTEELINQLSHERLTLYRQGAGRPFPRAVRARLVELIRELDRLWEVRRHELASAPFPLHAARVAAAQTPKTRSRNDRVVA